MTSNPSTRRRPPLLYYIVAIGLVVLGAFGALGGAELSLSIGLAAAGVMVLVWLGPPQYGVAVYRASEHEVVCRFRPWYQSNTVAITLFPIFGITNILQGKEQGSPFWLRCGGYVILAFGVVSISFALFQMTNRLSITPSKLAIRMGRRFDVSREQFIAMQPRRLTLSKPWQPPHFDLVYSPRGGGKNRIFFCLDLQFSVEATNLAAALEAWKEADPDDSGVMDRVEAILRGKPISPPMGQR